ncbi:hypothetical protein EYF80_013266 [Liparis tanakae]|uniref:Uncharacterized protein n=1 Tax=Liparis tanakae TaxID=230148 RepID=A0A4Z2IF48_9TELE|nr:hypothetical protein EYF80_013266 [Liparis tanakae]
MDHAVTARDSLQLHSDERREELRLDPRGVVGRELREELTLNSSELRFSEPSPSPSLSPLLMELLSSHLENKRGRPLSQNIRTRGRLQTSEDKRPAGRRETSICRQ